MLQVTAIAKYTSKTVNSEKDIYFLSPFSRLISKLKSHMFFTCKSFMFSDFTWKKSFAPENGGAGGLAPPPVVSPFPTALLKQGKVKFCQMFKSMIFANL